MITIGVDAHKRVHAAVALDAAGRALSQWRGPNTPDGWQALAQWAQTVGPECQWGIEGAGQYGRGLAQQVMATGAVVYAVNPRWTARMRTTGRRAGKSDALDAEAVARLVRQEQTTLPRVQREDETSVLAVLTAERTALVADQTRLRNQLHHLLVQLDPGYGQRLPRLTSSTGLAAVRAFQPPGTTAADAARLAAIHRLADRLATAQTQAAALATQIEQLAAPSCQPLTEVCGVGLLTAGMLAGVLGPGHRFATEAQLANYAGVAPLEASSGEVVRHRLNRGGQRQLNAIVERIALTQQRCHPPAQAYLAKKRAEGKTRREAIRALKRFIVRAIWRQWQQCPLQSLATLGPRLWT